MTKNTLFALFALFAACNTTKEYRFCEGYAQGTTYRIVYESENDYNLKIPELLKEFDMALSTYKENSIISRINKNETNVELNELFLEFYYKSRTAFEKTDGYFDITVGPLVKAWGFGVKEDFNTDSSAIDSIKSIVGMGKIEVINNKLVKKDPRIYLDGNAIAQGQSVDFIAEYLQSKNINNYLVEIGGEVRTKGINQQGEIWRIGVDKPFEGNIQRKLKAIVQLKNKALATSGNYRKFHTIDGIKYSHSINPKTGYPTKDILLSVTIVSNECSMADAYATACMVMGFEKAKSFVQTTSEIEAYFILSGDNKDFKTFQTEGFKKYLSEER